MSHPVEITKKTKSYPREKRFCFPRNILIEMKPAFVCHWSYVTILNYLTICLRYYCDTVSVVYIDLINIDIGNIFMNRNKLEKGGWVSCALYNVFHQLRLWNTFFHIDRIMLSTQGIWYINYISLLFIDFCSWLLFSTFALMRIETEIGCFKPKD